MNASRLAVTGVVLSALCACKGAPRGSAATGTADAALPNVEVPVSSSEPLAIFSAPIAGAQVGGGEAIAVGLVAAAHTLVAARVDASGRAKWTQTLLTGVDWSADAEVHAWPIGAGAAVTWRGLQSGRTAHVAAVVGAGGNIVQPASPVGSLVCATDDGLAWTSVVGDAAGSAQLALRGWTGTAAQDTTAPITDDVTLVCGAHRAYAIEQGDDSDDGTPTRVVAVGGGSAGPSLTIAAGAMGKDEDRDLFAWAVGDDFGLVRLSNSGALGAIEAKGDQSVPLRAERTRVPPEDDVVAVDADARGVTLVTTHDESDACPSGGAASSVHAIRVPRVGSGGATPRKLAPAACGSDVGPFWSEELHGANVVGWAERVSHASKARAAAPVSGFSWRMFDDAGRSGRVPLSADAITDAGCDQGACYVVVLVRPDGEDGTKPESIRVRAYP